MKLAIITLIIGAFLGASLTFIFNQFEKYLKSKKEKKKAIMCLRIELKRIDKFIEAISNSNPKHDISFPDIDIPTLDLTIQTNQFINYAEKLASKVYDLAKTLNGMNYRRHVSRNLLDEKNKMNAISNVSRYGKKITELHTMLTLYEKELDSSIVLLNEINDIVHFRDEN